MEAQGLGLKRRIGLLGAAVVVAATMLAAPAQAASNLGKQCERNHENEAAQIQCCKKRADTHKERRNCLKYVRSH
jgi:hypothetical protein